MCGCIKYYLLKYNSRKEVKNDDGKLVGGLNK